MSLRQSLSRFWNKAKEKLSPIFNRTKRQKVSVGGGGFNNSTLSLQSEPGIVVGGEFGGVDIKISTGKNDPRPENPPPMSRSAVEIGHDQGGSGSGQAREDPDRKGADRADTPDTLQSDIGNVAIPIPSISRGGEAEGM